MGPTGARGTSKYSNNGIFEAKILDHLNLSLEAKESLAKLANFGRAKSTWSSYRPAEKMLLLCQQEMKTNFLPPISGDNVLVLIGWLNQEKGCQRYNH